MEILFTILGLVLVAAIVGGGVMLYFHLKAKRREAFGAFAAQHGLEYSPRDTFGTLGWPFRLFRRGDGREVENVLWGTWESQPIQAFDYWYYDESTDSEGNPSRSYHHFSCVLVEVAASFPHLEIAREGLFTRLADHVGLEDIEFESPEFNRRYNVKAQNRKFAYELLDGKMLEWLVSFDQGLAFEVVGNRILAYQDRVKPSGLVPVIGTAIMFRDRIPPVALRLYPLSG
jgi:hypothetical protein